jgi:shikimate dehydrogenase
MPDRYAVIGNPIAHSKSPLIHAAFARATGEDIVYERILAPLDGFGAAVGQFVAAGGRGLNVTMPFKLEAHALARTLSPRARVAGAVNTLRRDGDAWYGDNTDGVGLVRDLVDNLGVALAGRDALVLGAGGATRGIVVPLLEQRPRTLTVANRTVEKAVALALDFTSHGEVRAASAAALEGRYFDVVVNAAGGPEDAEPALPWPSSLFAPGAFAYDLTYADAPTPFLRWARAQGAARCADGLGMLIEQAAESFLVWRGVRPDTRPVFALLRPQ